MQRNIWLEISFLVALCPPAQKPVEVKNYWHGEGGQYIEKSAYLKVRLLWMIPKLTPCTEQARGSTKAALKGSIPNHHMILRVPNFQNT